MSIQTVSQSSSFAEMDEKKNISNKKTDKIPLSSEKTSTIARKAFFYFSMVGVSYLQAGALLYLTLTAINNPSQIIVKLPITTTVFCSLAILQNSLLAQLKKIS